VYVPHGLVNCSGSRIRLAYKVCSVPPKECLAIFALRPRGLLTGRVDYFLERSAAIAAVYLQKHNGCKVSL
jgi:hypothetical protein